MLIIFFSSKINFSLILIPFPLIALLASLLDDTILFLENALMEATENDARWIFVFGHYHIFSNGFYDNYEKMEKRILPLLLKYNVDVYFCGHEHNFQILKHKNLHMIINGAATFNSFVEAENSNSSVETNLYHQIMGFVIIN